MSELEAFMREKHYNRIVKLGYIMTGHLWSKRITRSDSAMIEHIHTEVFEISESLFRLREEMKHESQT